MCIYIYTYVTCIFLQEAEELADVLLAAGLDVGVVGHDEDLHLALERQQLL